MTATISTPSNPGLVQYPVLVSTLSLNLPKQRQSAERYYDHVLGIADNCLSDEAKKKFPKWSGFHSADFSDLLEWRFRYDDWRMDLSKDDFAALAKALLSCSNS